MKRKVRRLGRGGGGGVIAPDAHTPTPTNYNCMIEKKEEVRTAAPRSVSVLRDGKTTRRRNDAEDKEHPLSLPPSSSDLQAGRHS